jgi:DNA polymerase/3'-5' exonuclease PolX
MTCAPAVLVRNTRSVVDGTKIVLKLRVWKGGMNNSQLAVIFYDIAHLLELRKDNRFKIRAYQRAARIIEKLPKEIESMVDDGESLRAIPGIGEAIERKINELITTGHLEYYEKLKADSPLRSINYASNGL